MPDDKDALSFDKDDLQSFIEIAENYITERIKGINCITDEPIN
jgi:hypothetical protein